MKPGSLQINQQVFNKYQAVPGTVPDAVKNRGRPLARISPEVLRHPHLAYTEFL